MPPARRRLRSSPVLTAIQRDLRRPLGHLRIREALRRRCEIGRGAPTVIALQGNLRCHDQRVGILDGIGARSSLHATGQRHRPHCKR